MNIVGLPKCVPALARDQSYQTDSLPKCLVISRDDLVEYVRLDDLRIKIIDLGGGSLQWSQQSHQVSIHVP